MVAAQEGFGAGGIFPARPCFTLYSKRAANYKKAAGASITYQSAGSGVAVKQIGPKTPDQILISQPDKDVWPISGATFMLMCKLQGKLTNAAETPESFAWTGTNGDKVVGAIDFVPLLRTNAQVSCGRLRKSLGLTQMTLQAEILLSSDQTLNVVPAFLKGTRVIYTHCCGCRRRPAHSTARLHHDKIVP